MNHRLTVERADRPLEGRVLGDYQIDSVASSGGMGIVYRATQRSLGRRVALKVIRAEIAADPDYQARFLREARQAASVDHPNVVSVIEVGNQDGQLFLSMQWIEGSDLGETIGIRGKLPADQAVGIAAQLGGALQAVHDAGLIHRDVKPANVLLRRVGGEDHAYLTDFGVAKPLGGGEKFTKSGMIVGTSGYMAPEQIMGAEPMAQTDIYALGCVFFRMLTGQPPFRADNDVAVAWAHLNHPRPKPSEVLPELGPGYDEFIATALAIEPGERFGSGAAFATALRTAHAHASRLRPSGAMTYVPPPTVVDAHTAPTDPVETAGPRREPTAPYPPYPATPTPAVSSDGRRPGRTVALMLGAIAAVIGIAIAALAAAGVFSPGHTTTVTTQSTTAQNTTSATATTSSLTRTSTSTTSAPTSSGGSSVPASTTPCDQNISAGPVTSCPFAENVFVAYFHAWKAIGQQPTTRITATSPVTHKSYTLTCTNDGTTVNCAGGNNAFITFPFRAILVY